ncbi:MAG: hypothetical protein HQL95_13900, partial [Magnetococcales bacterium]|nr:hypothetical protein [Magnetococcales bacterium]
MNTPLVSLRLSQSAVLASLLFMLICLVNLVTLHSHRAVFLEKYDFFTQRKRLVQTQNLYNNITRVQNQLTDISATLGMDHLDHGFALAREAADGFHEGLTNLEQLLNKPVRDNMAPPDLVAIKNRFDRFYRLGIDMAHAYMEKGTFQGNQQMKPFDAEADALQKILKEMADHYEDLAEGWRVKILKHPDSFVPPSGWSTILWFHMMGAQTREHYVHSLTHLAQTGPREEQRMELSHMAQELLGLVIQVQQWLTDLSATRGQDGLDDGRAEARHGAERFQSLLPAFLERIQTSDLRERAASAGQLATRFRAFYAKGENM